MNATYDIFRRVSPDKPPIWVETAQGLEQAKQRLRELSLKSPGVYLLWNATTGKFVDWD